LGKDNHPFLKKRGLQKKRLMDQREKAGWERANNKTEGGASFHATKSEFEPLMPHEGKGGHEKVDRSNINRGG